jgi:hypothetical protein
MSTSPLVGTSYHTGGSLLRLSFSRVGNMGVAWPVWESGRQCGNRARHKESDIPDMNRQALSWP